MFHLSVCAIATVNYTAFEKTSETVDAGNKSILLMTKKENIIPDISTELSKTTFSNEISNENKDKP